MTLGAMHELGASSAAFSEENHIDESNKNLDWALRRFAVGDPHVAPQIVALAAPSTRPERRANTADTYTFFAERYCLQPGVGLSSLQARSMCLTNT